ncbi:MAG TPA: hypothetical protein DCG69_10155 [Bacteroidales bacterium]|nr:hypothetical protein [Bacteroidales bacterium]
MATDIRSTDVSIPIEVSFSTGIANFTNNLKSIPESQPTFIYAYSWKDRAVYTGEFAAIKHKFDLNFLSGQIEFSQSTDFIFRNNKEAMLLCSDERKLVLLNIDNQDYKIISYDTLIQSNTYPLSFWNFPMVSAKELYFSIAYSGIIIKDIGSIVDYFSRKSGLSFRIDQGNFRSELVGEFPLAYQKGLFYNDFYSKFVKFPDESIANSFSCDDSIYLYHQTKKSTYFMGSKNAAPFKPYPLTELRNGNYKRQYTVEEPRYLQLIYDPFTDLVYRVYKHKSDYLVDGKVINDRDIPWSLLVSTTDFSTIEEYEFRDGKYSPIGMMPTADGLFILKFEQNNEKEIKGSLFRIPKP